MKSQQAPSSAPSPWVKWGATAALLTYIALVLAIDTMAAQYGRRGGFWGHFVWRMGNGFDLFKFVMWFVIPFVVSLPWMDWKFLGFKRWSQADVIMLIAMLAGTHFVLLIAIAVFPVLREYYPSMGKATELAKWSFARENITWTISWLLGWEFIHRYFLLQHVNRRWPRWGWILVPVSEGAYHLQKAFVEMIGMVLFSMLFTQWALRRKNAAVPFFAHLIVEIELIAFLLTY